MYRAAASVWRLSRLDRRCRDERPEDEAIRQLGSAAQATAAAKTGATNEEARVTPVIISPPAKQEQAEIKIYRGTSESSIRTE